MRRFRVGRVSREFWFLMFGGLGFQSRYLICFGVRQFYLQNGVKDMFVLWGEVGFVVQKDRVRSKRFMRVGCWCFLGRGVGRFRLRQYSVWGSQKEYLVVYFQVVLNIGGRERGEGFVIRSIGKLVWDFDGQWVYLVYGDQVLQGEGKWGVGFEFFVFKDLQIQGRGGEDQSFWGVGIFLVFMLFVFLFQGSEERR